MAKMACHRESMSANMVFFSAGFLVVTRELRTKVQLSCLAGWAREASRAWPAVTGLIFR